MALKILLVVVGIFVATLALGSDHVDGPVTTANRVADLTDLYAFPTPHQPGFITLILDAYPIVGASGHFTDKVTYSLILRKAKLNESTENPFYETSDEVSIHCTFKTPEVTANHTVTCKSSNGLIAENRYETIREKMAGDDFRLYAGMRSDPFFFNAGFAQELANNGKLKTPSDSNTMDSINVLSIVMEIEAAKLFENLPNQASVKISPKVKSSKKEARKTAGEEPFLIAVAAEVTTLDAPGYPLRRLDRVGRPEITNVSLVAHEEELDLRDQYNLDRPFEVSAEHLDQYRYRLARNIAFYDSVDRKIDWQQRDRVHLAQILSDDFLIVDMSKPCPGSSYFEIEKSLLQHRAHQTCGGRHPNDKIMEILYTLYIGSFNGKTVTDGVSHPSKTILSEFPYLATPELGLFARAKVYIAKLLLGVRD